MSIVTDAYNQARKSNPNLTLAEFRKTFNAPTTPTAPTAAPPAPQPTTQTPTAQTTQRDFQRESAALKRLGADPFQMGSLDQATLFEMAYSPEELAGLQEYQQVKGLKEQKQAAQQSLLATPAPSGTTLGVLEEALRTKEDVGKQALGESELFKQAGLGGYEVLAQSMNERGREMKDRYGSFVNQLQKTGGAMLDTHRAVADRYRILSEEYDKEAARFQGMIDNIVEHEQALDLMNRRSDLEQEAQIFSEDLWKKRKGFEKGLEEGLVDPETGEFIRPERVPTSQAQLVSGGATNGAGRIDPSNFIQNFNITDGNLIGADGQNIARMTSPYGADHSHISGEKQHNGIDFVFEGGQVRALQGGTIVKTGVSPNTYGGYVWIEDDNGDTLQYGHVSVDMLKQLNEGTRVDAGATFIMAETDPEKWGSSMQGN
jgi:murein DD-endopeptidase MepM/ murein hydrolase activator NlpD